MQTTNQSTIKQILSGAPHSKLIYTSSLAEVLMLNALSDITPFGWAWGLAPGEHSSSAPLRLHIFWALWIEPQRLKPFYLAILQYFLWILHLIFFKIEV